jgi:hypothetical protein
MVNNEMAETSKIATERKSARRATEKNPSDNRRVLKKTKSGTRLTAVPHPPENVNNNMPVLSRRRYKQSTKIRIPSTANYGLECYSFPAIKPTTSNEEPDTSSEQEEPLFFRVMEQQPQHHSIRRASVLLPPLKLRDI